MLLTVSKRLEFSSSRRLFVPEWSASENLTAFGSETQSRYGTGRNYVAYFVFTGRADAQTGMLINISEIKERAGEVIADQFDHHFLNEDNPSFQRIPPTAENIARQLFSQVAPRFIDTDAKLCAVHLRETPLRSATAYDNGMVEANYWFEFSAARQTLSPQLTEEENARLFGPAMHIHGHNYRARLTFRADQLDGQGPVVRQDQVDRCIGSLIDELDHRYLNEEIGAFTERPSTTESLAQYLFDRVIGLLPIHRIRLHERDDFFAEVWKNQNMFLGMRTPFSAAHRLHVPSFSPQKNDTLFGKCNNPRGHGHNYVAEATISGTYDARSGTLADFLQFRAGLKAAVEPWRDRHLDLETDEFRETPSTGENIVRALWPKIDQGVDGHLVRLRLWETENNRFTLRRT